VEKRQKITSSEWERSSRYRIIKDGEVVTQVESERPVEYYRTTVRYTMTNAKSEVINVDLVQAGLDRGWWSHDFRIVSEDIEGDQLNLGSRKWVVPVPANGTREFRVTYEARY
jgi:hypothetical protein